MGKIVLDRTGDDNKSTFSIWPSLVDEFHDPLSFLNGSLDKILFSHVGFVRFYIFH